VLDRPHAELLVSVHDVTPAHERSLEVLYRLLDDVGVHRYALLVVPNWHGAWPLAEFATFTTGLRQRAAAGAEIVLHGLRHDEMGQRRTLAHRARTFGRTDREGEFASLGASEAAARIDQGLAVLRAAGLVPIGFVPPAWLGPPELEPVVRDAGLAFTEDTHAVTLVAHGERIPAPATCWSTRRTWRRTGSVVVAALRLRLEQARPLVRVAFHPPDARWQGVLTSCRRTLEALLERRAVITYGELVARPANPRAA
jgi:predicted deacetylase